MKFSNPFARRETLPAEEVVVISSSDSQRLFFPWQGDFVYRPIVGLIEKGRLTRLRPARRAPPESGGGAWRCAVEIDPDWLDEGRLANDGLYCLESGRKLWPAPERKRAPETIAELIGQNLSEPHEKQCGGFLAFLRLGLLDQLSLLLLSARDESNETLLFERFGPAIARGDETILDARDALLSPDALPPPWLDPDTRRLFRWLVWSGNAAVGDALDRAASAEASRILDRFYCDPSASLTTISQFANYLARCALGSDHAALGESWRAAHANRIEAAFADFRDVVAPRPRDGGPAAPVAKIRYRRLLASMNPGECGRRDGGDIAAATGRAGVVMFGPYWTLPSGCFSLAAEIVTVHVPARGSGLWLEAVMGDLLLGWTALESPAPGPSRHRMEFDLTAAARGAYGKTLEFRLWTAGEWQGRIVDLTLERIDAQPRLGDRPRSLLPALKIHSEVKRSGAALHAPEAFEGHVFWGPYRILPPGRYLYQASAKVARPSGAFNCVMDVAAQPGNRELGALRLRPERGRILGQIEFEIAPGDRESKIEFRLWKSSGAELVVELVELRRFD
jgi:hypothetical protein